MCRETSRCWAGTVHLLCGQCASTRAFETTLPVVKPYPTCTRALGGAMGAGKRQCTEQGCSTWAAAGGIGCTYTHACNSS